MNESDPGDDWAMIVLDPVRGISSNFEPTDLVEFNPSDVPGEVWIRDILVDDLTDLLSAADDADAPLTLVSGYRTYEYQERLYSEGMANGDGDTTALPGHSEHQLGTTVDMLTPGIDELSPEFGETPAGEWLAANGPDYGFVLSYPADSRDKTCYDYEPWHVRYYGRDVAGQIAASGLSPREWLLQQSAEPE